MDAVVPSFFSILLSRAFVFVDVELLYGFIRFLDVELRCCTALFGFLVFIKCGIFLIENGLSHNHSTYPT